MRLARYEGESKVSDLIARLFAISGRGKEARTKEAAAALLAANPHLGDLKHVPVGTLLVVPDVAGLDPAAGVSPSGELAADALESLRAALDALRAAPDPTAPVAEEVAELARLQKSRPFAAAVAKAEDPDKIEAIVGEAAKAAEERLRQAKAAARDDAAALNRLRKELAAFAERHVGASPRAPLDLR